MGVLDDVEMKKLMNPPRTHTRATAMANTFVNNNQKTAIGEG